MYVNVPSSGIFTLYTSSNLHTWTLSRTLSNNSSSQLEFTWLPKATPIFFKGTFWRNPTWTTMPPEETTVQLGGTIILPSVATGYPGLSYQWTHYVQTPNGPGLGFWKEIPGATSAILILENMAAEDSGSYRPSVRFQGIGFACPRSCKVRVSSEANDWAVESLKGKRMKAVISDGRSPFFSYGSFIMIFAPTGSTYELDGLYEVPDSLGTYSYAKTSPTTATSTWSDAILGEGWTDLAWDNVGAGVYTHHLNTRPGTQTGRFSFQN